MRSLPFAFIFLSLSVILQSSVIAFLPNVFGGHPRPDVVFLLLLAFAIHAPDFDSYAWAMLGGILVDSFSIMPLGSTSIAYLLMMILIQWAKANLQERTIILPLVGCLLGTPLLLGILWLFSTRSGWNWSFTDLFFQILPFTLVIHILAIFPLSWGMGRLVRSLYPAAIKS
jgi:cell shape-determining protein MreD